MNTDPVTMTNAVVNGRVQHPQRSEERNVTKKAALRRLL
jgi:hypothetical protein